MKYACIFFGIVCLDTSAFRLSSKFRQHCKDAARPYNQLTPKTLNAGKYLVVNDNIPLNRLSPYDKLRMSYGDSLGEVGEFRIKGEGHWSGVMQRFNFLNETGQFVVPEPSVTDGPPVPYSLQLHRHGFDTYRVATYWNGSLQGLCEKHLLGRDGNAVSFTDFDQDEDGSYSVEHCMMDVAGRFYAQCVEHVIILTAYSRVRLIIGYGLTGELSAVNIFEETRNSDMLSPTVVVAIHDDIIQGIGAADEMGLDEEKVKRTSMSMLALSGGVWQGRGRVRLHGAIAGKMAAALSAECRVDVSYDWRGIDVLRKRMAVEIDEIGPKGKIKSRIGTRDPNVQRVTSWGNVDSRNQDILWLEGDELMMMMLPGGCYAVFPRSLGKAPFEVETLPQSSEETSLNENKPKRRVILDNGSPSQTEFGVFFRSTPTVARSGVTPGEKHLVRNVRVYREDGLLSSCLHSHHTWSDAVEEA